MTDLNKGILDVHNEAGVLLWISIVEQSDILDMLAEAWAGNVQAAQLSHGVMGVMTQIEDAPHNKPILCAKCPRPVRGTAYWTVVVMGGVDTPSHGLGYAVCPHCARTRDQAEDAVLPLLRRIWTGMRQIPVPHTGGGSA